MKTIMAKVSTDEKDDADLDEAEDSDEDRKEAESSDEEDAKADDRPSNEGAEGSSSIVKSEAAPDADGDEEGDDDDEAATQLGTQRYVLAAFFAAGIVAAYVLGKAVHGVWAWAANKDWFHNALPALAAVDDDKKSTYGTVIGAIFAIFLVIRTYRRAAVRVWADEVANELAKVKWPSRKEVSSSTLVVIAAGAVATIYLALLDRLWSFITDLLYGTGS